MRIGLTGTIGSGKSLVASILEELGAAVIDTDVIARQVVEPGTPGLERIIARWGRDALGADGRLDRAWLAEVVFKDPSQRGDLEAIVHPLIQQATAGAMRNVAPGRVTVLVVPLLFESGFDALVDQVWVVAADEDVIVRRIMGRDGMDESEARRRIAAQMPQEEKLRRARVVIRNTGDVASTRRQVEEAWKQIV